MTIYFDSNSIWFGCYDWDRLEIGSSAYCNLRDHCDICNFKKLKLREANIEPGTEVKSIKHIRPFRGLFLFREDRNNEDPLS